MRRIMQTFVTDPDTGKRWPIPAGGAEGEDEGDGEETGGQEGDGDGTGDGESGAGAEGEGEGDGEGAGEEDKPLGPAGEKALAALKAERRDLKRQLREARKANNKTGATGDEDELDADQLREQLRAEVRAEGARDRALDKLETKAAKNFHRPEDARQFLADRADEFLDDQGNPDLEAITEALDELLEERPYLAAQSGKRFEGGADGGARNGPKAGQLTRTDLERMSPEEIEKARSEGRLDNVLGIKRE